MEPNDSKKGVIVFAIVAFAAMIAVAVFFAWYKSPKNEEIEKSASYGEGTEASGADTFRPDNPMALQTVQGGTRETITEEIKTPDAVSGSAGSIAANIPKNVAIPSAVLSTGKESAIRKFEIQWKNNAYVPNTIVVNDKDVIDLSLSAVDGDFNVFFPDFGILKSLKKGETGKVQFQATPYGKYEFSCRKCPVPALGTLIVNQ